MPFAERCAKPEILTERHRSVAEVSIQWHASGECFGPRSDSVSLNHVEVTTGDELDHEVRQGWVVLEIAMQLERDVAYLVNRQTEQTFEISTVVHIALVPDRAQAEARGDLRGVIRAAVVAHDDEGLERVRNCPEGLLQRLLGICMPAP